jgi:hypothetical protein
MLSGESTLYLLLPLLLPLPLLLSLLLHSQVVLVVSTLVYSRWCRGTTATVAQLLRCSTSAQMERR